MTIMPKSHTPKKKVGRPLLGADMAAARSVSLPQDEWTRVDAAARSLECSRSAVVRRALARWFATVDR